MCGLLTGEYQALTKLKFLSAGGFVFPHSSIDILRLETQTAFLLAALALFFTI